MQSDERAMLDALGIASVDELFKDIPESVRINGLTLPAGISEAEVVAKVKKVLGANKTPEKLPSFLGAGIYDHFIPAAVRAIQSRSEFYTSYTPYQPEISQGILQALFEYQSMMCELTGMDAANTSMYDWATALGEAALMAHRIHGGKEFVVGRAMGRERLQVLRSYASGVGLKIKMVEFDANTGQLDLDMLKSQVGPDTCGVYFENPNFFGVFEEKVDEIRSLVPSVLVVGANPLSLAITKPPGEYGADIVIGEGQGLGNPPSYGGPLLGVFAVKKEHIRAMPGRIIGMTNDAKGKRAFCMTLQTREQHIRRQKATSNICTNEALVSIASTAYIAVLGGSGLRKLAVENMTAARDLARNINHLRRFKAPMFKSAHFNEFTVRSKIPYSRVHRELLRRGLHGGLSLEDRFPELGHVALFATTDVHGENERERIIKALGAIE
jgi:glycine dehydrogenase subunit 1